MFWNEKKTLRVCRPMPALLLLSCAACTASTLRGRVTDCRDSSPLEGADVQLTTEAPGMAWPAQQTGSDGAYAFQVESKGVGVTPMTLIAVKSGYQSAEKPFATIPGAALDVCLRPTKR